MANNSSSPTAQKETTLPANVEKLLMNLKSAEADVRESAVDDIGDLNISNKKIVGALITTSESDSDHYVRSAAIEALLAPAHRAILRKQPNGREKIAALESAAETAPKMNSTIDHLIAHRFYLHLPLVQALLTYLACVALIWLSPANALNEGLFIPIILAFTAFSILSPIVNLFMGRWWLNTGLFLLSWFLLFSALIYTVEARIGESLGAGAIGFLQPMLAVFIIFPLTALIKLIMFIVKKNG